VYSMTAGMHCTSSSRTFQGSQCAIHSLVYKRTCRFPCSPLLLTLFQRCRPHPLLLPNRPGGATAGIPLPQVDQELLPLQSEVRCRPQPAC
jgi:hypothetical protein